MRPRELSLRKPGVAIRSKTGEVEEIQSLGEILFLEKDIRRVVFLKLAK